ncbi:hypothetical protein HR11_04100 [Porphyromonas macacae]|nr:hypothetical protein HR11_04100 [Porphyromonas macacae]
MVENFSGKEKKSKLTSLKIRSAKNFQPSGKDFLIFISSCIKELYYFVFIANQFLCSILDVQM